MGNTPVKISQRAIEAVENIKYTGSTTWKEVRVKFKDRDYEENTEEEQIIISGKVKNTGTWIAEDIEVMAKGYDKYGFMIRTESTTLYGLLKPGETKNFSIKMNNKNLDRLELFLEWKEVE
jgi:hypothetical protein